ncbi:hypothetical protein ACIQUL_31420 [Streptomyces sp. NPDC090303]|uniref:hypothetical protein n=1 Tax=Streptomyces sp. NPDC090303 TaxID=3365960 RepID=UPI00382EAD66
MYGSDPTDGDRAPAPDGDREGAGSAGDDAERTDDEEGPGDGEGGGHGHGGGHHDGYDGGHHDSHGGGHHDGYGGGHHGGYGGGHGGGHGGGIVPVPAWPGGAEDAHEEADRPGTRSRIRRGLVAAVAFAGLVLAGVSVVAFLRDGHTGHPPRTPTAPAVGDVRIRVAGTEFCLGERRGTRTGQVHQLPCAAAGVPLYALAEAGGGRWRIVSEHPDLGPGCSGIPSGGRIPDAAFEDSACGDPTRVESFALEAFGAPVEGYRIVPVGSATPGTCVTVVGDRSAAWARLAQAPCAPDGAGQLFDFDRRD